MYIIKFVSYYLSKGFLILEQASQSLNNVPLIVQNHIHTINSFDSYYIMSFVNSIPSVANSLKKIYVGGPLWDKFTSEYHNDKNDTFGVLFKIYTSTDVDNIYKLSIYNEFKYNMDKSDYEEKQYLGVYITSEKR